MAKLINVGFGNVVNSRKIVAVVSPDAAPVKRMIQSVKGTRTLIDATQGRKTKAVIVTSDDYLVLSALQPETIARRFSEAYGEETREEEELQAGIEELKADNQPYQEELTFVKKVQSCADIARRDREMAEADTSGRSEEKREKQVKFPTFYTVQAKEILEENGKAEQQPLNQSEQNPEKKTSLLRKLDEKKKECAERDAKQQAVKKKRNYDMSL